MIVNYRNDISELLAYESAETPMPGAPVIQIDNNLLCVPQHFLEYEHTLKSVEEIVSDIFFSEKYPIFVCEDMQGIYVQIGIIGHDNYNKNIKDAPLKIVYGRKWRIEKNLPSSEIIQTTFLALKKAREHEIRELLRLQSKNSRKTSTPFSCHQDRPLLVRKLNDRKANQEHRMDLSTNKYILRCLSRVTFNRCSLNLCTMQQCDNGHYIIEYEISGNDENTNTCSVPELINRKVCILVADVKENTVLHAIMDSLIKCSDEYVEENFQYRNFTLFSKNISVSEIGDISITTRHRDVIHKPQDFNSINYETDATRVPTLRESPHSRKLILSLQQYTNLQGQLPQL